MSWDVMLFSRDPGPITSDMKVPPLGNAEFVRAQISKALPCVNWSDPAWGVLDGPGWSIEFNHQKSGSTDSVMLHVRGGGDPISAIVKLCRETGWVAFDVQSEGLIDLKAPSDKSWKEFQGFRDKISASMSVPPKQPSAAENRPMFIGLSVILFALVIWLIWRR